MTDDDVTESDRRLTKMRAAGHKPATDDEAQATLDATLHAMEWGCAEVNNHLS